MRSSSGVEVIARNTCIVCVAFVCVLVNFFWNTSQLENVFENVFFLNGKYGEL